MGKFYNLHYVSDLAAYTKGQGIPHWKPSDKLQLGTIISYSESDTEDKPEDAHVPFGVSVLTLPCNETMQAKCTMKSDGASAINVHPIFLDPGTHAICKKVDVATKTLVDNDNVQPPLPDHLKFTNPQMAPARR
jgi:hypothetical protein